MLQEEANRHMLGRAGWLQVRGKDTEHCKPTDRNEILVKLIVKLDGINRSVNVCLFVCLFACLLESVSE